MQTWTTRWSTYWALGGPGRTNSITPAPGNVVFIAPLARWLIARWSSIRHETSTLSQHLTTAGWYPRRAGNQDYRSSFGRPPAGDDFFEGCARDYFTTINSLGTQVWTYACGGTRYGATNAAPGMVPAFMGDVAELRARVAAWHQIAQNGSGGLPYRDPFRRSHTDRINAAQRIVNGGHRRNRQTQAAAGIHFQHGPQMSRWF